MKFFLSVVAGLVIVFVVGFSVFSPEDTPLKGIADQPFILKGAKSTAPDEEKNLTFSDANSSQEQSKKSPLTKDELYQWLDKNSDQMNSFSPSDQAKLDKFMAKMGPEDFQELKEVSVSKEIPVSQRILSVYMMGVTPEGLQALKEFLSENFELSENAPAHSMDEITNGKEKAIRVMGIEQLIASASSPQEARARLEKLIPTIENPWLKSFAQRKLAEIDSF